MDISLDRIIEGWNELDQHPPQLDPTEQGQVPVFVVSQSDFYISLPESPREVDRNLADSHSDTAPDADDPLDTLGDLLGLSEDAEERISTTDEHDQSEVLTYQNESNWTRNSADGDEFISGHDETDTTRETDETALPRTSPEKEEGNPSRSLKDTVLSEVNTEGNKPQKLNRNRTVSESEDETDENEENRLHVSFKRQRVNEGASCSSQPEQKRPSEEPA